MGRCQAPGWVSRVCMCAVAAVVLVLIPARAGGQGRVVRVGVYQNPPLVFMDETAGAAGVFIDLLKAIAVAESWDLDYVPCEWAACLAGLSAGDIDLVSAVSYLPGRDVTYDFHQVPVIDSWSQVYARPGASITQFSDVDGKRVAVLGGSGTEASFSRMVEGLGYKVTLETVTSLDVAFAMAAEGQVDAAIGNRFYGDRVYLTYGLERTSIVFGASPLLYVTAQGRNSDLLEAIDRHLVTWIETPGSPYYVTLASWTKTVVPSGLSRGVLLTGGAAVGLLAWASVTILVLRAQVRARTAHLEAANAKLRESEWRFRSLVESTDESVFTQGTDLRYTGVYGRWLQRPGQSVGKYLGRTDAEVYGVEIAQAHAAAKMRALQGESVVDEWVLATAEGTEYYHVSLAPLRDGDGTITGIVGIGSDITAWKRAEEALRRSDARFRTLFEQNLAVLLLMDPETHAIVDANPAAERFYGWRRDELLKMRIDDINTLPADALMQEVTKVLTTGRVRFRFQHRCADGSVRDVEVFSSRIEIDGKDYLHSIIHDVTERVQAERKLEAWQAMMQYIIRHDPNAIAVLDSDLRYVFVSDRYLQDYRITEQDLIGRQHYEVFPDITEPVREIHRRVLAGEVFREEDDRFERQDGTVDWVRWECRPWYLAEGEIGGIVLYTEVITERKQMEIALRALNVELEQRVAERTAELQATNQELEAFSYSVSHDLRAPLRAMAGFSDVLLSRYFDRLDAQGQHYLDRIQKAAQRMGMLINDLLDLSRVTRLEMVRARVDLSALGRGIVAELRGRDPARAVDVIVTDDMIVQGDAHLLRIALRNLLDNAWKFTGPRSEARIELGVSVQGGERVYFVRDNGVGFDMTYADKLFVPFQRLHTLDEFPGTGIGLVTVRRIVTRHGGRIWAEAAEGVGAAFYFTLGGSA